MVQWRTTIHATAGIASSMLLAGLLAMPAIADQDSFGAVSGVVTIGPIIGNGEKSSLEGGLGKLRSGEDGLAVTADATLVWNPRLTEQIATVLSVDIGSDSSNAIGVGEAYFKYRSDPGDAWRMSGRAGLFFPPVSLEHDGPAWSVANTLTPSAANTWIAEEVKTAGVEMTLRGSLGDTPIGVTLAAFGANDTAGALLAFRGWALHDVRASLGGTFALPETPGLFAGVQARRSRPVDEVDGRIGGYGNLEWSPTQDLTLSLFAYDNNGDEITVHDGQYAWRTRFMQAALNWSPAENVVVLAQVLTGETRMGVPIDGASPADAGFVSAYGLLTHGLGEGSLSYRLDYFAISDRTFKALDNNAEHGWSATLSHSWPIDAHTKVVTEGMLVASDRPDRARFHLDPLQTSGQARIGLRTEF